MAAGYEYAGRAHSHQPPPRCHPPARYRHHVDDQFALLPTLCIHLCTCIRENLGARTPDDRVTGRAVLAERIVEKRQRCR